MRTAHLFAGIGGGLLASEILGHESVLAVEIEPYRAAVLEERKKDGWFPGLHVHCGDVREYDFRPWAGRVDCISAGFPCQDISCAGRGAGITGERSGLVSEVFRAIDEISPRFVYLENSPAIHTKGRVEIITALVARGYAWKDGILAAADVGAGHLRKRWWLLADADRTRQLQSSWSVEEQREWDMHSLGVTTDHLRPGREKFAGGKDDKQREGPSENGDEIFTPDPMRDGLEEPGQFDWLPEEERRTIEAATRYTGAEDWIPLPSDPYLRGVLDGDSHRMDRVAGLGDSQVPIQAAAAWIILNGGI